MNVNVNEREVNTEYERTTRGTLEADNRDTPSICKRMRSHTSFVYLSISVQMSACTGEMNSVRI